MVPPYLPANYGMCWLRKSEALAGPVGRRQSAVIGLTNPLRANLNVNPVFSEIWHIPKEGWTRAKRTSGRPKAPKSGNDATMVFLHFAGLGKVKRDLMEWFALAYYGLLPRVPDGNISRAALCRSSETPGSREALSAAAATAGAPCFAPCGPPRPMPRALAGDPAAAGAAVTVAQQDELAMVRKNYQASEAQIPALKHRELMCSMLNCPDVKWNWEDRAGLFLTDPALQQLRDGHRDAAQAAKQWATAGLQNELAFWFWWLEINKEGQWVASSISEDWTYDDFCAIAPRPTARLLNAGSGPVAPKDIHCEGGTIEVISADGLADLYERMFLMLGLSPPKKLTQCPLEALSTCFPDHHFDLVHVRNALDHSLQPTRAIREMLKVTRPGGRVLLRHARDEAAHMNFTGMHQWSFEVNDTQMPHRAQLLFGRKRHHVDLHTEFRKDASVSSSIVSLSSPGATLDRRAYIFVELSKPT
ncbi:ubiE [Symbiodinium pilosum]|uniref:UbiE protein n=1 Tax=Symbiodinium pilosum TaxID=2952 RepID=A0A812RPP1_SYMPI|nr:ubiE [Symbiodinium pilosum]